MDKVFQKKMIDVGYKRCPKCGLFTPQKVYVSSSQKMFLGFAIGKMDTQYILTCPNCKSNVEITEERIEALKEFTKEHIPYEHQKNVWKEIFNTHKEYADYEDQMKFKDFFDMIKEKAREKIEIQISDKEYNYLFNAYLTNYARQNQQDGE